MGNLFEMVLLIFADFQLNNFNNLLCDELGVCSLTLRA